MPTLLADADAVTLIKVITEGGPLVLLGVGVLALVKGWVVTKGHHTDVIAAREREHAAVVAQYEIRIKDKDAAIDNWRTLCDAQATNARAATKLTEHVVSKQLAAPNPQGDA